MKSQLIGIEDMNFKLDNGEVIDGVRLHFVTVDPNVMGNFAGQKFVQRKALSNLGLSLKSFEELLNQEVNMFFNQKGRFCGIAAA